MAYQVLVIYPVASIIAITAGSPSNYCYNPHHLQGHGRLNDSNSQGWIIYINHIAYK